MNGQVFRKKSIDRVSSPEQLNEYIRVTNPSMWTAMIAIIVLLVGVCVWGMMGHLDTTVKAVAMGHGNDMTVYIKEQYIDSVKADMQVKANDKEYVLKNISQRPVMADGSIDEYVMYKGEISQGEWIYTASLEGEYTQGIFDCDIVIDRVSPIYFVLN